jgi:hypothetical protein
MLFPAVNLAVIAASLAEPTAPVMTGYRIGFLGACAIALGGALSSF